MNAPPNFSFQEKKSKLNWQAVEQLDLARIVKDMDLETLESHLSNLTFSTLEREDLKRFEEKEVIKLFKLGQLTIEYLLYS